jgi:hypothetical protein
VRAHLRRDLEEGLARLRAHGHAPSMRLELAALDHLTKGGARARIRVRGALRLQLRLGLRLGLGGE